MTSLLSSFLVRLPAWPASPLRFCFLPLLRWWRSGCLQMCVRSTTRCN